MPLNSGFIIRSYQAIFNGVSNNTPYFRERSSSGGFSSGTNENPTSYCLVPPPGTVSLSTGDSIDFLIEMILFPQQQVDYYGPNQNFSNFLKEQGNSWELLYREAAGNQISVVTSNLIQNINYPLIVDTINNTAKITIIGGKGYIPVTFSGLSSINNPKLWKNLGTGWELVNQQKWGNDFWQTDYDILTQTYSLTYNVNQDIDNDATATIQYYLGDQP